jgi:hypothetical protein
MKRQVMGREVVAAVTDGRLDFGASEQIFYGELDSRRRKRVLVRIIGECIPRQTCIDAPAPRTARATRDVLSLVGLLWGCLYALPFYMALGFSCLLK